MSVGGGGFNCVLNNDLDKHNCQGGIDIRQITYIL